MGETLFTSSLGQKGNIKELLVFAPLNLAYTNLAIANVQAGEIYKSSSNVMYSPQGTSRFRNYANTLAGITLDTNIYYLGAGPPAYSNANAAGGWLGSSQPNYTGSYHNPLFWMYTNVESFLTNYGNLYYTTFQSRSIDSSGNTVTGSFPDYLRILRSNGITSPTSSFLLPPTNAPAYNYQLSASKTTITILEATTQSINNWTTLLQDSIRSGSGNTVFETSGQGYKGQFNTSSGTYTFIRQNLPFNPVKAIPVEVSLSFGGNSYTNRPGGGGSYPVSVRIISGSTVLRSTSFTLPDIPSVGDFYPFYTTLNIYSGSDGSSANLNTVGGITMSVINSDPDYPIILEPINLNIKQPLTGKQIFGSIPITVYEPLHTYPPNDVSPRGADSGSYFVVTPYLNFNNFNLTIPNIAGEAPYNDTKVLFAGGKTGNNSGITQYDFRFAVYYFKTAYALWRDAWRCTMNNNAGSTAITSIGSQLEWINATSCPSWAASQSVPRLYFSSTAVRNGGWLYASRSANDNINNGGFISYGTSSTDAAVRNRSYVGITAEILGGSEILYQLKGKFGSTTATGENQINSASTYFPNLTLAAGGAIVVKASNIACSFSAYANRVIPSSYPGMPNAQYIYYMPGIGSSSAGFDIPDADPTIATVGLPVTVVNNCDVVPLSNWNWSNQPDALCWPTSTTWPYTDDSGFTIANYYTASDALYGYDGYIF